MCVVVTLRRADIPPARSRRYLGVRYPTCSAPWLPRGDGQRQVLVRYEMRWCPGSIPRLSLSPAVDSHCARSSSRFGSGWGAVSPGHGQSPSADRVLVKSAHVTVCRRRFRPRVRPGRSLGLRNRAKRSARPRTARRRPNGAWHRGPGRQPLVLGLWIKIGVRGRAVSPANRNVGNPCGCAVLTAPPCIAACIAGGYTRRYSQVLVASSKSV